MRLQKLKMQPQKSEDRIQKTEESRSYIQQLSTFSQARGLAAGKNGIKAGWSLQMTPPVMSLSP
jgi:hypothetical protein